MKHLIIGGGSIGKRHLKNLLTLEEKELYCFRRVKDEVFEREFNCKILTGFEEVQKLGPDVIYVCTPTGLHYEGFHWARELRAHLFMEKPLTHDEQTLEMMSQEWKNEKLFFIGFVLRYHPLIKILKYKIDQKIIGDVFSARLEFGSYLPSWHQGEKVAETYAGVKALGGGVINTVSHELDLMLFLFGAPQSVTAVKANLNSLHIDVEELAEAIFTYPWGLTTIHLDYLQRKYNRSIQVLGMHGKIMLDWPADKLIIEQVDQPLEIIRSHYSFDQLYLEELKDFLHLIKMDIKKHPLDFSCAELNTRWILNMHKSAEKEKQWEKSLTGFLT